MIRRIGLGLVAVGGLPAAAAAQQPPTPPSAPTQAAPPSAPANDAVSDEPDIIVRGQRNLPGAVIGDIPPEVQLGPADIRSYGVSSIADLLTELAPLTRSDRGSGGQPVVLLGGRRISSFNEIRDLPTEAIARVDILPEEVALKYGYPADQRVVNIVLRRRFRAITAELADRLTTQGDRNQPQGDLDLLNINRDRRVNLHSSYQESDALFESQRDLLPTIVDGVDQAPYRTLLGSARTMSVNGSYARNIFGNVAATVNARIEGDEGRSALGLGPDGVLAQRTSGITGHLGTTLNGNAGTWRWSVTGNYDDTVDKTLTDTGAADNFARSRATTAGIDAQTNGTVFRLPAGDVSTSVTVGGDTSDFTSRSIRGGIVQPGRVSRDSGSSRINLDVPLTSKAEGFGGAIGTLSVNFNGALERLSDFGTLRTLGYGANWSPIDGVRVIASVTDQDGAPTAQQLGNPQVVTPNVRLFDYVTGTTATVTTISGGNAALRGFDTHTAKLGLTLKPWSARDFTLTANYITSHVDDPAVSFPAATSAIAAAFPGRFTRDPASGQLLRVDTRPVNFARTSRSELRYGFNLSIPLKSEIQRQIEAYRNGSGPNPFAGLNFPGQRRRDRDDAPAGQASTSDTAPANPPPAEGAPSDGGGGGFGGRGGGGFGGGGFGGGRGGGFGGRGGGGGRLQFALFHTWHFRDDVLIAADGPTLDLLDGDAIGSSGGQSRHEIEGQAGYSNNGLGARLSVNWRSATQVNGGTPTAPQRLDFGSLGTANLRFFFDPTARLDLLRKHPWVRGMRLTFSIDNLFDTRQRVTDQTGMTPVNYQPDLLDPLGRTVRLSIRKLFF